MIFTINPQSFNAVIACVAKNDVRYYLNSFFVDVTNNKLVATNGHVLATAPLEKVEGGNDAEPETHGLLQGFLFKALYKPISNKGDEVYIDCANRTLRYWSARQWKEMDLETINGRYVDYTSVEYAGDHTGVERISFNAEYIAKPARWAGFDYCCAVFNFHGRMNGLGVHYQERMLAGVRITLMPSRI